MEVNRIGNIQAYTVYWIVLIALGMLDLKAKYAIELRSFKVGRFEVYCDKIRLIYASTIMAIVQYLRDKPHHKGV